MPRPTAPFLLSLPRLVRCSRLYLDAFVAELVRADRTSERADDA